MSKLEIQKVKQRGEYLAVLFDGTEKQAKKIVKQFSNPGVNLNYIREIYIGVEGKIKTRTGIKIATPYKHMTLEKGHWIVGLPDGLIEVHTVMTFTEKYGVVA